MRIAHGSRCAAAQFWPVPGRADAAARGAGRRAAGRLVRSAEPAAPAWRSPGACVPYLDDFKALGRMTLLGFDRRDVSTVRNFFRMFLRDRFLGSRLGTAWAVLNPLMMLGIYTYVFAFVFKARLPG